MVNYINCDTIIPLSITQIFYGFLMSQNTKDSLISEINKQLLKINKKKNYKERYNDYLEKKFDQCDNPININDNVLTYKYIFILS